MVPLCDFEPNIDVFLSFIPVQISKLNKLKTTILPASTLLPFIPFYYMSVDRHMENAIIWVFIFNMLFIRSDAIRQQVPYALIYPGMFTGKFGLI